MEEYECRSPESEELPVASTTEASLRSQITDLLIGGPRDVRMGWLNLRAERRPATDRSGAGSLR